MSILKKRYSFSVSLENLVLIYILYVRSLVEQNVAVWNSTITQEEREDLERVQKIAMRIILKDTCYENALRVIGLETLEARRKNLCLTFAKRCLKHEKTDDMFPVSDTREPLLFPIPYAFKSAQQRCLANRCLPPKEDKAENEEEVFSKRDLGRNLNLFNMEET